ncbi:MAG: GMC family oxidoreductase [Thermodesulfobacteriota bacterium]|nr:GMC family oxidoreductase [Thermodesulfobacteriota bacterium]
MEAKRYNFDAIVIGSGPGGATVAKELTARNKSVLILERGDNWRVMGTNWQAIFTAGIPGRNMLLTNNMLAMVRGTTTGGSSILYYGTAFDPPVEMLKSHGMDITAEVDEIREELPTQPLKDELVGPMAKRIMGSARDLGYDWNKLPKFVYQDKCKAECWRCNYGCPYGAKWNARMFVEKACENGAILVNRARVSRVITENKKAVGVEYTRWGKPHTAYAPKVVLSAGGIGSPAILRKSGIADAGYDFFYDPLIAVMGTVKDIKGGKEFPMATGVLMEEDGYVMTDMAVPRSLYMLFAAEVFRFHKLLSHGRTLQIMIKAKDSLGGKVTDKEGVRKKLANSDRQKLLHGYDRAKQILKNAGAKNIFKSWYIAAHPGGTVKVGDILDANLETEYENLYVCDCSVIPEAWGLPPTFTLVALGKRLAKHISS